MKTLALLLLLMSCGHRLQDAKYRQTGDPIRGKLLDQIRIFRSCYTAQFPKEDVISESNLFLTITPQGEVQGPRVEEISHTPPPMQECLARAAASISFPATNPPMTVDLHQPLKFHPRK